MVSEELIELYNKLDKIDAKLVGFHNLLRSKGMTETGPDFHIHTALTYVLKALEDLDRRIQFAKQDEKEKRNEAVGDITG